MQHTAGALSIAITSLVLAAAPAAVPGGPISTQDAVLTGRVTVQETDRTVPVRRARVIVSGAASAMVLTTDTDTEGRFRISGLPAGPVRLRVEKPGFVMPGRGSFRTLGVPVTLAAGGTTTQNVAMLRGAALEGQVVNENGRPVSDAEMSAVRFVHGLTGRHPAEIVATTTDSNGRYRLHTLAPGEYYVRARLGVTTVPDPVRVPGRPPLVSVTTYFPGTARGDQARAILVGPGQEVRGLDFAMPSAEVATVSGTVIDSGGRVAPRMTMRMQAVGGPTGEVRGGFLPQNGSFFFRNVPPGDYWISAVTDSDDRGIEAVVYRLPVSGTDVPNVTLRTAAGRVVSGRIVVDGDAAAPPGVRVVPHGTAFELPRPRDMAGDGSAPVAGDGAFELHGLFGPSLLRVEGLPPGHALAAVLLDGADITDVPTDFQTSNGTVELNVTARTGHVTGVVTDAAGAALAGVTVVAFAVDDSTWGGLSRHVRAVETGPDGGFAFDGLLPGGYFVAAAPNLEQNGWMSPNVLRRLSHDRPITVSAGESVTIALTEGGLR